jgi:hypothetical protein
MCMCNVGKVCRNLLIAYVRLVSFRQISRNKEHGISRNDRLYLANISMFVLYKPAHLCTRCRHRFR